MLSNRKLVLHTFKAQPCALFVLIALFMPDCPDPVGEKWLARRTGYTRKTVRESGLYFLEDLGIIKRISHRRGWSLTAAAAQLPLPFAELPGAIAGNVLEAPQPREGKVYPHGPTTTATTTIRKEQGDTAAAAASEGRVYPHENGEGKVYPHGIGLSPELSTTQQAVSDYLQGRGIGAPTCDALAALPWLTVEYARAHIDAGEAEGVGYGLIIHRMKAHDPAPGAGEDPCPQCGRALFDDAGRCRVCSGQIII